MYLVYMNPNPTEARVVGVCFTERGAERAARHYLTEYSLRHPDRYCKVGIEETMPYFLIRTTMRIFKI